MINLKKYNALLYLPAVLFLVSTSTSCGSKQFYNNTIEGKKIAINADYAGNSDIENFVAPYRNHIDNDLDSILAYAPETLDKSKPVAKWQTPIGNLLADITLQYADSILFKRYKRHADAALLNHGGIRAILPKGNVTARTAYEIMPFENSVVVIALKGEQLFDIARYIVLEKKPHPLAGMHIALDKDNNVKMVTVKGVPVSENKVYNIATSDYLSNGGDNMNFFKKALATYDIDYKLRNLIIDYFKATDTIKAPKNPRISTE